MKEEKLALFGLLVGLSNDVFKTEERRKEIKEVIIKLLDKLEI